ncbi:MAG: hypothetical protein ACKVTZ_19970, partial [Bacteroidia bacterium]
IQENKALLRANFQLIAQKIKEKFIFSSVLAKNTEGWKARKIGNITFHYKNVLDNKKAAAYQKLTASFDEKLKIVDNVTNIYCCEGFLEAQNLIGLNYKSDYNGEAEGIFAAKVGNKQIMVLGQDKFGDFDPHDLWHDRLSLVVSRNKVYKPIDEGCAYLYGGSWGFSWEEILQQFLLKVATNPQENWAEDKENPKDFGENKSKHLMVDYVVNALIIKKIEKEKGFSGVWELLNCGTYPTDNENYYRVLEKLTGITKANYNEKVWELIRKERK